MCPMIDNPGQSHTFANGVSNHLAPVTTSLRAHVTRILGPENPCPPAVDARSTSDGCRLVTREN